jgi:hypothetical protein
METGPVRDSQQTKQCVYNILCDCGRYYNSETSRLLEVCIKEQKYKLTQGLMKNQNDPNMRTKKAKKYVGVKRRSCRLNQTPHTGNTKNLPTYLTDHPISQPRLDISPIWTPVITAEVKKNTAPSSVD